MGGMSIEREVSFNSGRTICDHLDTHFYEIIPLFQTEKNDLYILPWRFLHRGKISDFAHRLEAEAQKISWDDLKALVDFVYIAVHGRYAEDGTLQGFLEVLNIPYLGAKILASARGMDKIAQKELLAFAGIEVPRGISIAPRDLPLYKDTPELLLQKMADAKVTFPVIVKPNEEGSSLGISVVFTPEKLIAAIEIAAYADPARTQSVLIEEKIEGMEFSCITLFDKNDEPLPLMPTEVVHEAGTHFHDYEQKYMPGRSIKFTPARTSLKNLTAIKSACLKATRVLDFKTISRIDGFLTKDDRVVLVDPNSLSGMAPSSFLFNQAAEMNMSHTDLINHLIEVELFSHGIELQKETTKKKGKSMEQGKMRVAVLLGGDSNERETSLDSGRNICYKLSPHKYEVIPLFVDSKRELYPLTQRLLVHNSTKEIEHDLDRSTRIKWHDLPKIADFVFIGLHGGIGENGAVQGTLEMLNLPYNGPGIAASALCLDKYKTNSLLRQKGFNVPDHVYITQKEWAMDKQACAAKVLASLSLPVIVKPHNDGCSMFVTKPKTEDQLLKDLTTLFASTHSDALVEECIIGTELTVGVIGNDTVQALPASKSVTTKDILTLEEKFLPGAGENQTPAPLPNGIAALVKDTIEGVFKAAGCSGYSRIDCFYQTATQSATKKDRIVIIEINTVPALTPATCLFHQAAEVGIRPMDFIDMLVSFGIERHKNKSSRKDDASEISAATKKQQQDLLLEA